MKINRLHISSPKYSSQRGQTFIIMMILIGLVLLVVLGVAADYTQLWAHRQMAQAAADAACQAAAADLFLDAIDPTAPGTGGVGSFSWIGSSFNCSTNTGSPPCVYASRNGYNGSNVSVTFPSSLPGVAPIPGSFGTIAHPYIQVTVTDPIAMSFTKLASGISTVNISAKAGCGVLPVAVPVPLVILHKTAAGSLTVSGSPTIKVYGGPQRSIEVDSNNVGAMTGGGTVDLSQGGPASPPTGSDFGVFGGPNSNPGNVLLGTTGHYISPASPIGDPFVTVSAPTEPTTAPGIAQAVPLGVNGCPDPNGCVEFTAGDYTKCQSSGNVPPGTEGCLLLPYTGSNPKFRVAGNDWAQSTNYKVGQIIQPTKNNGGNFLFIVTQQGTSGKAAAEPVWPQTACARQANATCSGQTVPDNGVIWQNVGTVALNKLSTGIFDPGLYYVDANGLSFGTGSTARVSMATGDGSLGVMFYFSSTGTVSVTSNSGKSSACTSATNTGTASPSGCVVAYNINGATSTQNTGGIPSQTLKCPAGAGPPAILQNTPNLAGNVLLGPCTGTYASPDGNRGFLFFQNRAKSVNASWGGGGQFLSSGFMYFTSGNGSCGSGASCLSLQGSSGAQSYTLGNIVVDELSMGGSPTINMILNPTATFQVLKPSLLE